MSRGRSGTGNTPQPGALEQSAQERDEDERTVIAVRRNVHDDGWYRVYFADGTYLEIAGAETRFEEGLPADEDEEEEDGWEASDWYALPWSIREEVRRTLEDTMRNNGEELAEGLLSHPYEEQLRLIAVHADFHEWSLAHVLLERSQAAALANPRAAVELARLAERLTHFFPGYDPARVSELRSRSLAHLGNALRILGELTSAREAFRDAERALEEGGSLNPRLVRAEILSLKASLLREERRFEEARTTLHDARALYEEEGATYHVGRLLVQEAKTLEEQGLIEQALALLQEAEPFLDPRDLRMKLCLAHNLADYLAKLGRFGEAGALLPEVYALSARLGNDLDLVRLRWVEARIASGLGMAEGEVLLLEVRSAFEARGMALDAALVALDLAMLYLARGDAAGLKRLSEEVISVFASRAIHREAILALLLFIEASRGERLTADLIRELARYLEKERRESHPSGAGASS